MERTLLLVKPHALSNLRRVLEAVDATVLEVVDMRTVSFGKRLTRAFYAEHVDRDFFPALQQMIEEGPALALVLEGKDAVARLRTAVGPTDPSASTETLRAQFGQDLTRNGFHASDSVQAAEREIALILDAPLDAAMCSSSCHASTAPTGDLMYLSEVLPIARLDHVFSVGGETYAISCSGAGSADFPSGVDFVATREVVPGCPGGHRAPIVAAVVIVLIFILRVLTRTRKEEPETKAEKED